jgi:hypothetical protein
VEQATLRRFRVLAGRQGSEAGVPCRARLRETARRAIDGEGAVRGKGQRLGAPAPRMGVGAPRAEPEVDAVPVELGVDGQNVAGLGPREDKLSP